MMKMGGAMKKDKKAREEAQINQKMGREMMKSGKSMEANGKWLMKVAGKYKSSKHNHTLAGIG